MKRPNLSKLINFKIVRWRLLPWSRRIFPSLSYKYVTTQLYHIQFRLFYYTTAKWCLFLQAQRNAYPWLCVMCISVYNTKFIAKVNMEPLFTKRFMWYHFMVREKEGIDTRDIIYIYSYIRMPYIILFFRPLHWNHDNLTMS